MVAIMKIDTMEQFELLPRAPIVEAVIQVLARAETSWNEEGVFALLKPKLAEFQSVVLQASVRQHVMFSPALPPIISQENLGRGVMGQSKDRRVQFSREGLFFSKLQPYQSWNQFSGDALRLWNIYAEVARPLEMQRIGLRFINKIQLPPRELDFEKYIQPHPVPPVGLEPSFLGFFHQDTLGVPDHPYAINIVRTIQPPPNPLTDGSGLIIDIDAFTTQSFENGLGVLEQRLAELRWLKNKAMFVSVTPAALQLFR
jgi:uncharacterized protein (TIGR04255 family)